MAQLGSAATSQGHESKTARLERLTLTVADKDTLGSYSFKLIPHHLIPSLLVVALAVLRVTTETLVCPPSSTRRTARG